MSLITVRQPAMDTYGPGPSTDGSARSGTLLTRQQARTLAVDHIDFVIE